VVSCRLPVPPSADVTAAGRERPWRVLNCLHRAHFGGGQWRVVEVGEELRSRGFDTVVMFPAGPDMAYERFLRARGFPYRRVALAPLRRVRFARSALAYLVDLPRQVWRLHTLIRAEQIDLVHANGIASFGPVLAALIARRPLVWHWNDMLTPRTAARLVAPLARRRGWTVAVSSAAVATHYGLPHERAPVLSPPIPASVQGSGEAVAARTRARPGDERVIGFVSNLIELKGALEFVEALGELRDSGMAVKGVMVGATLSGHEAFAERLERRVAVLGLDDHLDRVGYRYDVSAWLRSFDALAMPSHSEAGPIVVLQAMDAGVPLVATDVGNVRELVGGAGLPVVGVRDVAALSDGLRQALAMSEQERSAYAERVTARVAEYSSAAVAARHAVLYAQCLARSQRRVAR